MHACFRLLGQKHLSVQEFGEGLVVGFSAVDMGGAFFR